MKNSERVVVLIDNQNIYYSVRRLYGGSIDYHYLINQLVGRRKLVKVSAFVVSGHSGEKPFFEALKKLGIKLRTKKVRIFQNGTKEADGDMGLAIEAIMLADYTDTIIIVSGDGDFIPLVKYLKNVCGKRVEVAAFGCHTSRRLKLIADQFYDLGRLPKVIFKPQKQTPLKSYAFSRGY
jgi:uncharacterized LabA/DUF88 family protein